MPRSSFSFILCRRLFLRQSRPFPSLHELSSYRRKSPPIGLPRDSGVLLQLCLRGETGSCGFCPLTVLSQVRSCGVNQPQMHLCSPFGDQAVKARGSVKAVQTAASSLGGLREVGVLDAQIDSFSSWEELRSDIFQPLTLAEWREDNSISVQPASSPGSPAGRAAWAPQSSEAGKAEARPPGVCLEPLGLQPSGQMPSLPGRGWGWGILLTSQR